MMRELADNILDIAQNSISAGASLVEIDITVSHSTNTVALRFADNGCGMSGEELQQVFKRFYRADSSRTLPGNGLGLSLVQAIVNAHNGEIEISSQLNEGTYVWVSLPLNGGNMNKN